MPQSFPGVALTLRARLIDENDETSEKAWAKAGKVGDPLVVQMLLKKQASMAQATPLTLPHASNPFISRRESQSLPCTAHAVACPLGR